MAKFVIAGSCDCPYMAKLELLAYQLSINLPHFDVHKIVLPAEEWPAWLRDTCDKNGWKHEKSPIVWRELVERGGKGYLMGGFNEFCEYAQCYYGVTSSMMTELMLKVRDENVIACANQLKEEKEFRSLSKPIHVCIVNAISPVAYHFIPQVAAGDVFGPEIEISIRLVDSESNKEQLEGVVMETQDLAFPLLRNIEVCTRLEDGIRDASAVIFLEDEDSPEAEESRDEFLRNNAERFCNYAKVLDEAALPIVKVLIAGSGPVNFGAYVLLENISKIQKENIVASPRLQDRRARAILSRRLMVNSDDVKNVLILGNCSNNSPEKSSLVTMATGSVHNYDGAIWGPSWFARSLVEMVYDREWMGGDFVSSHCDHDTNLTKALKHSASMSEAASLASLMRDWVKGSPKNEMTSLGVLTTGQFDVSDCVFSLPVRFVDGKYVIATEVIMDQATQEEMKKIEKYLKKDLHVIYPERFEELFRPVFGEESPIISPSISKTDVTPKTISGLTVIPEDVAAESQSAEEPVVESSGDTQSDQDAKPESDLDAKPESDLDAKGDEEENRPEAELESQSQAANLNELVKGNEQTNEDPPADPSQ